MDMNVKTYLVAQRSNKFEKIFKPHLMNYETLSEKVNFSLLMPGYIPVQSLYNAMFRVHRNVT